jgi:hypothetical protein
MAIEIVDFPMKNGGSFHCYVSSPEDNTSCKIPSSSIGIIIAAKGHIKPGWWYTYPSEKYEFDIPNCFWESHKKNMVPVTTKQQLVGTYFTYFLLFHELKIISFTKHYCHGLNIPRSGRSSVDLRLRKE